MARIISVLIGVVLMGLGVWAIVAWWGAILVMLRAVVAVLAVLLGLGIFIFGLSEMWAGEGERPPSAAPLAHGPGEPA